MNIGEIEKLKKREARLRKQLLFIGKLEKKELEKLKDKVDDIHAELQEIEEKINILEGGLEVKKSRLDPLKKFWKFLKGDTWQSWLVSLILLIVFIKLIFFPVLSLVTGSPLPLVIVESCSMYHDSDFDEWWNKNADWYGAKQIKKGDFFYFPFKDGLNKGDIIFVWGRSEPELGDIIVFEPNKESTANNPIIHRVVTLKPLGTKGDNGRTNPAQLVMGSNNKKLDETNISEDRYLGKAVVKFPLLGWVKLIFFEHLREPAQRGLCV